MITMTLNCRGLTSLPKKLAVHRLISDYFVDVIYLQETMGGGEQLVLELETLIFGWKFLLWMLKVNLGDYYLVGGIDFLI